MPRSRFAMYLAVLPEYREACIAELRTKYSGELMLMVASAHLDPTVKTGVPSEWYRSCSMVRLRRVGLFLQIGHWAPAITAQSLIVDLNPRSLSAWLLLLVRRALGRRTLVWGHLNPQRGKASRTAALRLTMRRLAAGTITYTYSDMRDAQERLPGKPVWVAPNSLYPASKIVPASSSLATAVRVLYVGRLEPAKKVTLLVEGFAQFVRMQPRARLTIVGTGSEEAVLRRSAEALSISGSVEFVGQVTDVETLVGLYTEAFCATSPGFAGLGLTQALGFGVPMVIADREPHSPEIELAKEPDVHWFTADRPASLAEALQAAWEARASSDPGTRSRRVRARYSAEAMAGGLHAALEGVQQFS